MSRDGFLTLGCIGVGVVLLVLAPSAGCGEKEQKSVDPADSCPFAQDGVCDEPANCALGTDSTDCEAACAAGENLYLIGAACAYRDPPEDPPIDPTIGTGGSVHLTGYRDGTITVASGEFPGQTVSRHYRLYVPDAYDPARPTPLVIMMGGHRGDLFYLAGWSAMPRTAEMNRFIVAYAEQEFRSDIRWAWWTDWNWTTRPDENPDLEFLSLLVARVKEEYNVDRTRVFAAGHSRGAAMAIIAALELPDIFAGACSQSGFTEFSYHRRIESYTGRRVPMVLVHGVRDRDVPIDANTSSLKSSDALRAIMFGEGWTMNELLYYRLENVGHRWQPQLNQQWWDFLSSRPHEEAP